MELTVLVTCNHLSVHLWRQLWKTHVLLLFCIFCASLLTHDGHRLLDRMILPGLGVSQQRILSNACGFSPGSVLGRKLMRRQATLSQLTDCSR